MPDPGGRARGRITPRERDVLAQAALGLSNRKIGETLDIAEQTVKNHFCSAMRKLATHDRTHAVVVAIGEGWIAMPVRADMARSEMSAAEAVD